MKAYLYIPIIAVFSILASCNSALYNSNAEYDDLYYTSSDEPVADIRASSGTVVREGVLKSDEYFNNIYAADTLVSEEYSDAVDINNITSSSDGTYDYYDDYSYANRLRRFHGNYFDPYWRDPFYYGMYSPFRYSFGMGFGYPYYGYSPYYYDPFYSDYYYGGYYSPYYSSYYSPFRYGYGGYGYGGYGYGYGYGSPYFRYVDADDLVTYGRRERQSNTSSRWNTMGGTSRRDGYISGQPSSTERAGVSRRTAPATSVQAVINSNDSRRTVASSQEAAKGNSTVTTRQSTPRSSAGQRPEYGSTNRTYTPSYNNPRMNTRPSYNNSRVPSEAGQNPRYDTRSSSPSRTQNATQTETRSVNSSARNISPSYSGSSSSGSARRSTSSYSGNQGSYTVPSRRSVESSRAGSYSGGSERSSSYSGSGRSSSSYSGGSSYSGSSSSGGGSYSGGGSSSSRSSGSSGSRR